MSIKVSVIIPVHNRENVICRALGSLEKQTLRDFEVIIIDDGSTDTTADVVRRYLCKNIRYIYQEQRGPGAARNAGLRIAQGKYIAYLDSDDELLPDHLERTIQFLDENPRYDAVFCLHETFNDRDEKVWVPVVDEFNRRMIETKKYTSYCSIVSIDIVHKKECINRIGFFPEDMYFEDWSYWIKLTENCNTYWLNETLGVYHANNNSITKTIDLASTYKEFVLRYLQDNSYTLPYEDYILDTVKVLVMFTKKDFLHVWDLIEQYDSFYPSSPAVMIAAAHVAYYQRDFQKCREYCCKALNLIGEHEDSYSRNIYFLGHYLITASCAFSQEFLSDIENYHFCNDIGSLQKGFLELNLKLLRYFGGMFFPIAMRLVSIYKTECNDI